MLSHRSPPCFEKSEDLAKLGPRLSGQSYVVHWRPPLPIQSLFISAFARPCRLPSLQDGNQRTTTYLLEIHQSAVTSLTTSATHFHCLFLSPQTFIPLL